MSRASLTIVDAHVHIHACFPVEESLDSALEHFRGVAAGVDFSGVLMLAEPAASEGFSALRAASWSRWRLEDVEDERVRRARRADGASLWLVAGFQVATDEGLEVLCLGCSRRPADRDPIECVVRRTRDAGGVAVVPWGAGKWLGRRGRILSRLIDALDDPGFFLGDNGGRPAAWRPRHFARARRRGVRVLPGSDPLPFVSESRRIGGTGFRLRGALPEAGAARELIARLVDPSTSPEAFGSAERPLRFVRNQLAMQVRRRAGRGAR